MKILILTISLLLLFFCPAIGQQSFSFGPRISYVYSELYLNNTETALSAKGSGNGYQLGLFIRKDRNSSFMEGGFVFTDNVGGIWTYNGNENEVTATLIGAPFIIGVKIYPFLSFNAGLVPYTCIDIDEDENIMEWMGYKGLSGQISGLDFITGAEINIARLCFNISYEGCLAGGFMFHETDETVLHRVRMVNIGIAFNIK
jgi:hypothetical protein